MNSRTSSAAFGLLILSASPCRAELRTGLDRAAIAQSAQEYIYYQSGVNKADSGDNNGAIIDFTKAIGLRPGCGDAYSGRGNAKRGGAGDFAGAIIDFNRAIEINASEPNYYFDRGMAKDDSKGFKGAILE